MHCHPRMSEARLPGAARDVYIQTDNTASADGWYRLQRTTCTLQCCRLLETGNAPHQLATSDPVYRRSNGFCLLREEYDCLS